MFNGLQRERRVTIEDSNRPRPLTVRPTTRNQRIQVRRRKKKKKKKKRDKPTRKERK
jgi:hypothetical protein